MKREKLDDRQNYCEQTLLEERENANRLIESLMEKNLEIGNLVNQATQRLMNVLDHLNTAKGQAEKIEIVVKEILMALQETNQVNEKLKEPGEIVKTTGNLMHKHIQSSNLDALTEIGNLRAFRKFFKICFKESESKKGNFCISYLDINDLKEINDIHSHKDGNTALVFFVKSCLGIFGNNENSTIRIFRIGGDEFAIVFKGEPENLQKYINSLTSYLQNTNLSLSKGNVKLTFSYGIADYLETSKKGTTAAEMINKADQRMYKMKNEFKREKTSIAHYDMRKKIK